MHDPSPPAAALPGDLSLDDVRDIVFRTDLEGRWTLLNAAWTETLGFSRAESLGRPFLEYVHPDDREANLALFAPLVRREKDHCLHEVRYLTRDGGVRWVEVHARLTLAPGGAASGTAGTLRDVTGRRRAEQAARDSEARSVASEARLRLALSAARLAEWEHDLSRDEASVGPEWQEVTGRRPHDAAPLARWLEVIHPDDREAVRARVLACRDEGATRYEAEYRVEALDGRWRWLRSRGRVTARAAGRPSRLSGVVMDVTEVHSLQEKLLAATRLASVGTLAAGVAHEINNPLAWVTSNVAFALDALDARDGGAPHAGAEVRRALEDAREGALRIAGIVKAMRSLGRPERPEPALPVDVGGELLSAVQMVRTQLLQRAELELDVPAGLPPVCARTSELGRVFVNLLVNAAQAIPEGDAPGHRVRVRGRAAGGEVVVEVSDTGVGIAPEARHRIFDAFFTTKAPGVGTGLGLTIVRSIVDEAGGRVEVESEPGRGSTFRVILPAAKDGGGDAPRAAPHPAPAAPRRRVLVVDDEPLVLRALQRSLARRHEVTALASAPEALRRIQRGEAWDAVLCDFSMPELDGVALFEAASALDPALGRRWGFMTGGIVDDRTARFVAERNALTVAKPAELAELLGAIERLAAGGA